MSTEIVKRPMGDLQLATERPSHTATDDRRSTAGLEKIVRPSFVKIVQKASADELVNKFGNGAIVLTPDMVLLAADGQQCSFVPILYYTEYCKWSSIRLKGIEPMIAERSFDPNSRAAIKSRSLATWSEPHPNYPDDPKYSYRYCEHTNFIVKFTDDDLIELEPCLISFARTNFVAGARLGKLVLGRRAPLYSGQYVLGTRLRTGQENAWKVYTADNHPEEAWVRDPVLYKQFESFYDQFNELYKARNIEADYEQTVDDFSEGEVVEAGDTGKY